MAGTQMPEKWRHFADTMRDGLSTRRAAARVDINQKTAWRDRHKVMAFLMPTEAPPLGGIVEADETYFRRNFKGSKSVGRRPRRRGSQNGSTRGLGKDKVAVVLPGTSNTASLPAVFRPMLNAGVTLCTDGSSAWPRSTCTGI